MFENTFKNIDDVLWKDEGCSTELDYIEQTSWVLFLKYLSDLEKEKEASSKLKNQKYEQIFDKQFRWNFWAYPTKSGKIKLVDHDQYEWVETSRLKEFDFLDGDIPIINNLISNKITILS